VSRAVPRRALAVAALVFGLDQLVKWIVTGPLGLSVQGSMREITSFFQLNFVANCGVSLGLLRSDTALARWGLVALTTGIATGVLVWMWRERNRVDQFALAAVFGGALGNIADRVIPHPQVQLFSDGVAYPGCVIDYADLHFGAWRPFLVFNLADAAITVGVLVLLVRALLMREKPATTPQENVNA
jgi:signal peptidase II